MWRRHVEEIETFFLELSSDAHATIAYRDLLGAPEDVVARLAAFPEIGG